MSAIILDGKAVSKKVIEELRGQVENLAQQDIIPGLAVVLVGDDPASQLYVKKKEEACRELGIRSEVVRLDQEISQETLMNQVDRLNSDGKVHGIIIQLPLPKGLDTDQVLDRIAVEKDVDCFHPFNFGQLAIGQGRLLPCTPAGVMELLKRYDISLASKDCVVIGKSNIVGKPLALMLLQAGATVTVCHSQTRDLADICRRADIIVSAVGKEKLVTADMVKAGAVVVDVGINRNQEGKVVGDVDFGPVEEKAGAITPVPGGIGPMTIAMLMKNVVQAAQGK